MLFRSGLCFVPVRLMGATTSPIWLLQSALRPKRCLLSINLKLRNIVASKLILDWSPKQIPAG